MIEKRERVPTVKSILKLVKERIDFPYSREFLRRLLKNLGFVWKKCSTNRQVLMERNDVAVARIRYLRNIKRYREEGRTIVYTDETYVHTTHSAKKCWQTSKVSLKISLSRGERFIVVHAGSKDGFINGASLVFRARSTTGDYHHEMNSGNFFKWLNTQLIPNLPPRSVLVVDNAAYHCIQIDKCPTSTNTRNQITDWLTRNNIDYDSSLRKQELLDLCRRMKPAPRYILDETLRAHGHECLRLPPYHAELNAIELILSQVKGNIGLLNVSYTVKSVQQLTTDVLASVTAEAWTNCCRHVEKIEQEFWRSDVAVEKALDEFIICVSDEEATDTASENSDYSDTDSAFDSEIV